MKKNLWSATIAIFSLGLSVSAAALTVTITLPPALPKTLTADISYKLYTNCAATVSGYTCHSEADSLQGLDASLLMTYFGLFNQAYVNKPIPVNKSAEDKSYLTFKLNNPAYSECHADLAGATSVNFSWDAAGKCNVGSLG
jgi:hypothetical protein